MNWKHDDLLADLAEHLARPERMMWLDMQLGPAGSPRPDIYTMAKSYTKPSAIAYEIKVSASDYRSDITSGKWQTYLKYAQGVTFCVPAGLVGKSDLPNGCGLMARSDKGWRTLRAPTLHRVEVPMSAMQKLLIDGLGREYGLRRKVWAGQYTAERKLRAQYGDTVGDVLRNLADAQARAKGMKRREDIKVAKINARCDQMIVSARSASDATRSQGRELLRDLCQILNINKESNYHTIRSEFASIKELIDGDPAISSARREVESALVRVKRAASALGMEGL